MSKKIRFGIIGCGVIANSKHMPSLKRQPEAEMVAFCDINRARAEKAALEFGTPNARVYEDYHDLLNDPEVEVVHVATPNRSHCEITIAAFEANKHVLCEKPMAANADDAQKMIDAWKKTDRKFTVGFQWRFRPETLYLYDMCSKGELGEIYYGRAQSIKRAGAPTWGSYLSKEAQGGGALTDSGPHSIDLTLWLMNNYLPVSVSGSTYDKLKTRPEGNRTGPWNVDEFDVEESAFGHVKMANGASVFIEASWLLNFYSDFPHVTTLCGTKGGVDLLEKRVRLTQLKDGEVVTYFPEVPGADPEKWFPKFLGDYEQSHWVHSLLYDEEPLVSPYEALMVSKIISAVYASSESGKTVYFDQEEVKKINDEIQKARSRRNWKL